MFRFNLLVKKKLFYFICVLLILKVIDFHAQTLKDSSDLNLGENQKRKIDLNHNFFLQTKFEFAGIVSSLEEQGIEKYYGLDLRLAWQNKENDVYSTIYKSPKFGIGFYAGTFDNNTFGEPNGLYGFFESDVGIHRKKWNWIYSIGLGLSYNFHIYDPLTNPDNILIGSHENIYLAFSLETTYNITDHWIAGLGFGFKHFSNGKMTLPNKGINLIPITTRVEYNFGNNNPEIDKSKITKFIPFNLISIFAGFGIRGFEVDKAVYFKSTLGVNALRQPNYKIRYGLGFDLFYTAGSLDRITSDKSDFNKQFSYGITTIFEWVITKRLYTPVNFGVYLNKNEENYETNFFQRLGMRYLFGKQNKMLVGVSLKVTEFHADFVEWTVGYTFKNDKNEYKLLY